MLSPSRSRSKRIDPAHLCRALDDGIEHRLHIRGRAADDAEHFGRRRLVLQSFARFRVALLNSWNSRTFSIAITA